MAMHPGAVPPSTTLFTHYLPGEICLVLECALTEDQAERLYENGQISNPVNDLIKDPRSANLGQVAWPPELERDLTTFTTKDQFTNPDIFVRDIQLRPLELARERLAGGTLRPWVVLPGEVLFFFQLGATPVPTSDLNDHQRLRAHLTRTRETVNFINRYLRGQVIKTDAGECPIVAATPNWLTGAHPHTSDSPGSKPRPVKRDQPLPPTPFKFDRPDLQELVDRQRNAAPGQVVVAVLDTSPLQDTVDGVAHPNGLLHTFASADRPVIDRVQLGIPANMAGQYLPEYRPHPHLDFEAPDHGLFVAGIIRDIAPRAEIYLIRVLNNRGVGDLLALTRVLQQLPGQLIKERGKQRLVVNLSLGADLPPGEHLLCMWMHHTYAWLVSNQRLPVPVGAALQTTLREPDIRTYLDLLHRSLAGIASSQDDVLLVAAAGNDNDRYTPDRDPEGCPGGQQLTGRPEPRYPARYDSVLGVAALRRDQATPADFSNRGDVLTLGNGVATLGGNATADGTISDVGDAVVGIFSADPFPVSAGPNETGWAYWSGTSFATPIISGIAAALWMDKPGLGAPAIIDQVTTTYASNQSPNNALSSPFIAASQG